MRKLLFLFLAGLLTIGLTACSEAEVSKIDNEQKDNGSNNAGEQKKEEKQKPETQNLKVGESVNFDGLVITLNEARIEPGGEFDEPSEDQFIVVNLTAENTTDEEQVVSSLMNVEFKDAEGYSYNITLLLEGTKGNFDGKVEPGGKLRGEIAFDVPKSDTYELHFSDPFKSGKAIWVIPSSDLK